MTQATVWSHAGYFLRPYRAIVLSAFLMMVLAAGLEALTIGLLLPLFAALTGSEFEPAAGMLTRILGGLIASIPVEDDVVRALICVTIVGIAAEAARFSATARSAQLSTRARRDVSVRVFSNVLAADVRRVSQRPDGEWLHRIITAPFQMTTFFTLTPQLAAQFLRVVAVVLLLASLSWSLTIVGVLVGSGFYAVTRYVGKHHLLTLGAGQVASTEAQASTATQGLGAIREIKVYDTASRWLAAFRRATDEYTSQAIRQTCVQLLPVAALPLAFLLLVVAGVGFARQWAGDGYGSLVPLWSVFVAGLGRVSSELSVLGKCHMQIVGMLPFAETVRRELDSAPSRRACSLGGAVTPPRIIRFDGVSYTHEGRTRTLDEVSLSLKRGELTLLVGASGSGKSTLVDLLLGLYSPDSGRILIDDYDLQGITPDQWHCHVGYVGQELFLFHGTVWENIAMGRSASQAEVRAAAEQARARNLIEAHPDGLDTVVGDRGAQVSGGERQRITIARALLKRPGFILLDEATSSLDVHQERQLLAELKDLARECMVLVVTHRLASAAIADRVIVLEQGRVVETGTHQTLLSESTVYRRLWTAQAVA